MEGEREGKISPSFSLSSQERPEARTETDPDRDPGRDKPHTRSGQSGEAPRWWIRDLGENGTKLFTASKGRDTRNR